MRGMEKDRGCVGKTAAPPPDAGPFLPLVRRMMMNLQRQTFPQVGILDFAVFGTEQRGPFTKE